MRKRLATKFSKVLLEAIEDLETCEQDPRYRINMGIWVNPIDDDVCEVCFAGAVMECSLNKEEEFFRIGDTAYLYKVFSVQTVDKLLHLNTMRNYNVSEILEKYYKDYEKDGVDQKHRLLYNMPHNTEPNYTSSPEQFKRNMRYFAEQFKQLGF